MTTKKYGIFFISVVMIFCMAGCNDINQSSVYLEKQKESYSTSETEPIVTTSVMVTTTTTTTELTGPEYTEIPLNIPDINSEEVELVYQAEDTELPAAFEEMNEKTDYTGSGYISGLSGDLENTFIFNVEVPSSQHYDVSIIVCADAGAECNISINGGAAEDITIESSDRFISATIPGIYMEAGVNQVSIQQKSGDMLLDCLEIRNNTSLEPDTFISSVPVNEKATPKAKQLLEFLCDNYGKAVVSGQQVSDSSNSEIVRIVNTTGKYPAIRFADMYQYSLNGGGTGEDSVSDAAINWSENGGITGLMWHWFAPLGEPGTLQQSEEFSLASAVTFEDVASLTPKALEELHKKDNISEECIKLIEDIDNVSEGLKKLKDADIPVLWRPLHHAGTNSYWWDSEGSDAYLWLWDLVYRRMTEYHRLDNLLWVWSGVDEQYLPDSSRYDIAAADIYLTEDESFCSGYESYYALQNMAEGKLVALSECSSLPDITSVFRDGSVWSYFGLWYEPYLEQEDNEFVDTDSLIRIYNSEGVLTREDYIEYCSQRTTDFTDDETVTE